MSAGTQVGREVREVQGVTAVGLLLNLLLSAFKLVVGLLGHSQALVADAVHSLSDAATDVAVMVGARYWSAPPDASHPYGHGRIETMVAFSIGVILAGVGAGLGYQALLALKLHQPGNPSWPVFVAACISIVVKEGLFRWQVRVGRRLRSSAMVANAWHHRSDALSSIPVAAAVLATRLVPGWVFLDAVAAVVVCLFILHASWTIIWPAARQLTDIGASGQERDEIERLAMSIEGVREVHAVRTRQLGPGLQVDLHLLVDPETTVLRGHEISHLAKSRLMEQGPHVLDVLIHIEPYVDGVKHGS